MTSNTTAAASDRFGLAAQGRQIIGSREGDRADMEGQGSYIGGCFGGRGRTRGDEEVFEEGKEMALWSIVTAAKIFL